MQQERQSILIVDDQPANLISYEALLDDFGINLVTATSGNEALALLLKHDVALVLLDVQMPGMDGFEVAQLMRKSRRTQNIPIIFVTAISKEQRYIFKGYQSGAVDYLTKPIEPQILRSKVKVFLDLDAKTRQLRESMETIRQSLQEVEHLKERNELLLRSVGEGILGLDIDGRIIFANPAAEAALSRTGDSLVGTHLEAYLLQEADIHKPLVWRHSDIFLSCSHGLCCNEQTNLFAHRDGMVYPIEFTATPMMGGGAGFAGVVLVFKDITDRRAAEQQLKQLAQYDTLTGLANRNLLSVMLVKSLIAVENARHQLALLFLDLDRFKYVNDTFGHHVGDQLLQQVAGRLRSCVRDTDFIARLGGDEFTVILESSDARHASALVSQKIIDAMTDMFRVGDHEIHVGSSIGVVVYPEVRQDAYGLLRCADLAMYKAKSSGRNNFKYFTPDLERNLSETMRLESRLRRAIDNEELSLVYQPQLELNSGRISGFEALLRWTPTGMNAIPPSRFIPLAEDTGIIVEIGEWVLREACKQMRAWQRKGLCGSEQRVSVNLSVRQLRESDIVQRIHQVLKDEDLSPSSLELEITESMIVENPDAMNSLLSQLAHLGVSLAIDDFGTGYSSMLYLKQLPLHSLKIDRTFIKDIGDDQMDEAITRGVIALAHSLDLKVIAEGVEGEYVETFLRESGCDYLQGFWFSQPLSAEDMESFLRSNAARVH